MKLRARIGCLVGLTLAFVAVTAPAAPVAVRAPLVCSHGGNQWFEGTVTMAASKPTGATFTVRIDSASSGKISHEGLKYIHDILTDFVLPAGTSYVEGTAHIVADTGTDNVRAGARVWQDAGKIHVLLPAHVENGGSYTGPSIEFDLKISAPPGSALSLGLEHYETKANAAVVGDVVASCDPTPKPFPLGVTHVDPAALVAPARGRAAH